MPFIKETLERPTTEKSSAESWGDLLSSLSESERNQAKELLNASVEIIISTGEWVSFSAQCEESVKNLNWKCVYCQLEDSLLLVEPLVPGSLFQWFTGTFDKVKNFFNGKEQWVREYKIVKNLFPLLEVLLRKYGDFPASSELSLKLKLYFLTLFCSTIKDICYKSTQSITSSQIANAWVILEAVRAAGFRIDFATNYFKEFVSSRHPQQEFVRIPWEKYMDHHSHEHPITIHSVKDTRSLIPWEEHVLEVQDLDCSACGELFCDRLFACFVCGFQVHKPCLDIPKEICVMVHKDHTLNLKTKVTERTGSCNICRCPCSGFVYDCDTCCYTVCAKCALLRIGNDEREKVTYYFSDGIHPMNRFESCGTEYCHLCGVKIQGSGFQSLTSQFEIYVHTSCVGLPSSIRSPRTTGESRMVRVHSAKHFFCGFCYEHSNIGFCVCGFCRKRSNIGFCGPTYATQSNCLKCTILVATVEFEADDCLAHSSHGHLLIFQQMDAKENINCFGCGRRCSGPSYGCPPCSLYLHESCTHLQEQIKCLFDHKEHLTLVSRLLLSVSKCDGCGNNCGAFTYRSKDRNAFELCIECSSRKSRIQYPVHPHPLILVKNPILEYTCEGCQKPRPPLPAFACLRCHYYLHLQCGPLPPTIKNDWHDHELTLQDSFIDEATGEYICERCGEDRDPDGPVYCCDGCNYPVSIDCLLEEVLSVLNGEHGKMISLHVADTYIRGRILDDDEDLDEEAEGTTDEVTRTFDIVTFLKESIDKGALLRVSDEEKDNTMRKLAWEEAVKNIKRMLSEEKESIEGAIDEIGKQALSKLEQHAPHVIIETYEVSKEFSPLLRVLFRKYGDFTVPSKLRPELKLVFLELFSVGIKDMFYDVTKDVTDVRLAICSMILEVVHEVGFEIQFCIDHFKNVACAHYGKQEFLKIPWEEYVDHPQHKHPLIIINWDEYEKIGLWKHIDTQMTCFVSGFWKHGDTQKACPVCNKPFPRRLLICFLCKFCAHELSIDTDISSGEGGEEAIEVEEEGRRGQLQECHVTFPLTVRDLLNSLSDNEKRKLESMTKEATKQEHKKFLEKKAKAKSNTPSKPLTSAAWDQVKESDVFLDPLSRLRSSWELVKFRRRVIARNLAPTLKALFNKHGDFTADSKLTTKLKTIVLCLICITIADMGFHGLGKVEGYKWASWSKSLFIAQKAGFRVQFLTNCLEEGSSDCEEKFSNEVKKHKIKVEEAQKMEQDAQQALVDAQQALRHAENTLVCSKRTLRDVKRDGPATVAIKDEIPKFTTQEYCHALHS